ncbi:MAG: phosphoadenosine phosphosulfate reductase family protein [Ruminococcus sp.]|nr:phosphoadenosine phosphosulfate reductase family protein [Ruminococcus sp.]
MEEYRIVSFSGGKDSTAMLLRLMEIGEPINEVIWCDTYKEFPAMYRHVERIKSEVENAGIKFTVLKNEHSYDYLMFEKPVKRKKKEIIEKYSDPLGFSWAGPRMRWCTRALKLDVINKHLSALKKKYSLIQYTGIAADEQYRLERKANSDHIHPLVNWGWTEKMCLEYCYSKGYDWEGLYEKFNRVSCWCCPLQNLDNLRTLRKEFPGLWEELKEMDRKTWRNFRADYTAEQLEKRFALEDERAKQGLTNKPKNKDFRKALKEAIK